MGADFLTRSHEGERSHLSVSQHYDATVLCDEDMTDGMSVRARYETIAKLDAVIIAGGCGIGNRVII